MLKIKNVSKTFNIGTINEKKALKNINLELNDGDFVTIIGGNGAGKSTLMNMIAGVYPIDCGHILIDNKEVSLDSEYKRASMIGRVFKCHVYSGKLGDGFSSWKVKNLKMGYY